MGVSNIKVKPMYVYIGKNTPQVQSIKCKADVSSSLNNKYFLFMDAAGAKRYAWFSTGAGVDPTPAGGWVAAPVVIAANDSATAVATALAAVLTAVTGFDATSSGSEVTLTATANGYAQPAYDAAGASATGFAFKVTILGQVEAEAGCIQGDIEISGFEQSKIEITCHDTGTTIRDERISGYSKPTLSMTFQESDKESIKKLFVLYGMNVFTPVGADKDAVFGYGPANVGGANPKVLVRLHPVELDLTDKSEDFNFFSAELALDTFTFSGENVSAIPATFNIFPDETKPKGIQFFMIGDAVKAGY